MVIRHSDADVPDSRDYGLHVPKGALSLGDDVGRAPPHWERWAGASLVLWVEHISWFRIKAGGCILDSVVVAERRSEPHISTMRFPRLAHSLQVKPWPNRHQRSHHGQRKINSSWTGRRYYHFPIPLPCFWGNNCKDGTTQSKIKIRLIVSSTLKFWDIIIRVLIVFGRLWSLVVIYKIRSYVFLPFGVSKLWQLCSFS